MTSVDHVPLRRPLLARDRHESGRAATPLELLFDLVFVVAIASNAAQLHHGIAEGHYDALVGYTMTWFAIWWAWMGYTWFASSYDNNDVGFRLLSLLIMAGALMLAAGVPDIFADGQSLIVVLGYAVMRLGMVGLWLRAAAANPAGRRTALTYAIGITAVQLIWVARLWAPEGWLVITFFACVALELSIPLVAERAGESSTFHPHHIAERYGLLTLIVLGEVILSSVQAVQGVISTPDGFGWAMVPLVIGGLLLVFALWWLYFAREHHDIVDDPRCVWIFGYGHLPIFASTAAVGATLAAAVDVAQHEAHTSARVVALLLATALAIFVLALGSIRAVHDRNGFRDLVPSVVVAIAVWGVAALGLPIGWSVLAMGLVLTGAVVRHVWWPTQRAVPHPA